MMKMRFTVIYFSLFLSICFLRNDFCIALSKESFAPLPCWLVKGSRVHVCTDSEDSVVRTYDAIGEAPVGRDLRVKKRPSDYFKDFFAKTKEYSPFWYRESPVSGSWFRAAVKKALTDVEMSSMNKRKFDSIAYDNRFGFGG